MPNPIWENGKILLSLSCNDCVLGFVALQMCLSIILFLLYYMSVLLKY